MTVKISALPSASALDGTELIEMVQGGVSVKSDVDAIETFLPAMAAGTRTSVDTATPGEVSIDVTLSTGISGGDTLAGGSGASDLLTLASTSNATRGQVICRDQLGVLGEDLTPAISGGFQAIRVGSDFAGNTRTLTFSNGTASQNTVQALRFNPTVVYTATAATFSSQCFVNGVTVKNDSGAARTITAGLSFNSGPTLTADDAAVTFGGYTAFIDTSSVGVTGAGAATVTLMTTVRSQSVVNTGATVTTRRGFWMGDGTGSGTITTQVGVDIDTLAKGGTNIGLRNASTSVKTPTANTNITAVSATIAHTAALITLTADNSYTLTSTPTISDGQNGEELIILNVDTADTITIQDQGTLAGSNLRLSATTIALGPRDSIRLVYNSTIGDWVQVGQTNVL